MKGKIFIWIALIVMLSCVAFATPEGDLYNELTNRWTMEAKDGANSKDDIGGVNLSFLGNADHTSADKKFGSNSTSFDGTGDAMNTTKQLLNTQDGMTIAMWFKSTNSGEQVLFDFRNGVTQKQSAKITVGGQIYTTFTDAGSDRMDFTGTDTVGNTNRWILYVATVNFTEKTLYTWSDGVADGSNTDAGYGGDEVVNDLNFGADTGETNELFGYMDEIMVFNKTFGLADVLLLNASLTSLAADVPPSTSINLSTTNPITNQIFNVNTINFNGTGNFSNPADVNCSLYINGTVNGTINNFITGVDEVLSYNITFPAGETNTYSYLFACVDNSSAVNSTATIFYIDQVNPTLTTNFANNTFIFNRNYTTWFNSTDSLALNSVNISIDGITHIYNDTMTGTFFNKQVTINPYNLSSGKHNLTIKIADGHTASEIPEYNVYQPILDDWIKYSFKDKPDKYVKIKGLPDSIFDKFTTEKKLDRYEFDYEPWDKTKTEYSFEVEASDYIKIIDRPDTKYKTWIIMDDKWMDFYTEENPNDVVEITRISDKRVSVKVSNVALKDGKIKFKSIGDLNIVTDTFEFYTTNFSVSYTDPVFVLETQNIILDIDDFTGLSSTATIKWNNTAKSVTKTTPAGLEKHTSNFETPDLSNNANITFTWNYSLVYGAETETGLLSYTQEVLNIGIDNCSTYTTQALNYSIRNESDNSLFSGDVDAAFRVWVNNANSYKAFNLSWHSGETFGVCINPSGLNVSYYTQLEYVANGQTKTYYINDANLDNVTNFIDLYIADGTTQVTFTVIDENDNIVEGAFINVLSYDLGTDSFKTTEIIETDSNGKAVASIILNTQFYKFLITLNDEVVLSTSPTKITSTTQTFQILLGTDYLSTFTTFNNVACSMSFDNASKGFSYTFIDSTSTAVSACLEIVRSTLNSETVINSSCIDSAAGTINMFINEDTQDYTYYARGLVDIDGNEFICADRSVSFEDTYKKFGTEGIMGTFLLVVALVAIGLWSPIVAALLATVALIISWFLGFFFLTPGVLIVYVILSIVFMMRINK